MNTAEIKRNKGRLCSFIMGLISSTIGLHFALFIGLFEIIGFRSISLAGFSRESSITIGILVVLLSIINVVGAAIIRYRRIVGGVIMMAACVPLFSLAVLEPFEYMIFLMITPVGIASAILAFIPLSDGYLRCLSEKQQFKEDLREFLAMKKAEQVSEAIPREETLNR